MKREQLYSTYVELFPITVQTFCKMNNPIPNSSGSIPVFMPTAKISPATNAVTNIETGVGRRSDVFCDILHRGVWQLVQ